MSTITRADLEGIIRHAIAQIAPDVNASEIEPDEDYREEVELDSMDFLAFVAAVERETRLTIPELDYPDITTIGAFADYLLHRLEETE